MARPASLSGIKGGGSEGLRVHERLRVHTCLRAGGLCGESYLSSRDSYPGISR